MTPQWRPVSAALLLLPLLKRRRFDEAESLERRCLRFSTPSSATIGGMANCSNG